MATNGPAIKTWKIEHFLLLTFFENLNFENNDVME